MRTPTLPSVSLPRPPPSAHQPRRGTDPPARLALFDSLCSSSSPGELGKLLGAKWKSLSDAEKQPYLDLAEKDKTRAADALSVYEGKGANKSAAASKKKEQEDSASDDE